MEHEMTTEVESAWPTHRTIESMSAPARSPVRCGRARSSSPKAMRAWS